MTTSLVFRAKHALVAGLCAWSLALAGCASTQLEVDRSDPASPRAATTPLPPAAQALKPDYDPAAQASAAPAGAHDHGAHDHGADDQRAPAETAPDHGAHDQSAPDHGAHDHSTNDGEHEQHAPAKREGTGQ
jgi:hypothetical protein